MASTRQRFDCIMPYLEAKHTRLAGIFKGFCAEFLLRPGKFAAGIALLVPDDKIIGDLESGMNSPDEAAYNKAFHTLCALVLRQDLQTVGAWTKAPISDSRKPQSYLVKVKSASGSSVELDGAQASKDAGFVSNGKPISVWKLTGKPPMGTELAPAPVRVMKKVGKGAKLGSHQFLDDENAASKTLLNSVIASASRCSSPAEAVKCFTSPVASAVAWLISNRPEQAACVIPLLNNTIADFFIVFNPLCSEEYFLDLSEWYGSSHPQPANFDELVDDFIRSQAVSNCAFYKERKTMFTALDICRLSCGGPPTTTIDAIRSACDTLAVQNSIGSCQNVLPAGLHEYLAAHAYRLTVWADMRFMCWHSVQTMADDWRTEFPNMLASIITMLIADSSDYSFRLGILNRKRAEMSLAKPELNVALNRFVYSSLGPIFLRPTRDECASMSKRIMHCIGEPIIDDKHVPLSVLKASLLAAGVDSAQVDTVVARLSR